MIEDNGKDVQGIAVYAEWKKPEALTQIFFTPDGYSTDGTLLRAQMYRRTITTENPRKQWRSSTLWDSKWDEDLAELDTDEVAKRNYAGKRLQQVDTYFNRLISGGWVLNGEPLLIEVSKKDIDDMSKDKTPNKFLYRVDLSKKAKSNFEDPLKNDEE